MGLESSERSQGLLVAFMGLPGSGKSRIASMLSMRFEGSVLFQEPEEPEWPDAVLRRHESGYFAALSWFRSMRVPQLFEADRLRRSGTIAIVDSYYDKLIARYINDEKMGWLIPADDPYFAAACTVAELDWVYLPDADAIVFLEVTQDQWQMLLEQRKRDIDREKLFLESFSTQDIFRKAAEDFAAERGAALIVVRQQLFDMDKVCDEIHALLQNHIGGVRR